jgi:hypothetical protein
MTNPMRDLFDRIADAIYAACIYDMHEAENAADAVIRELGLREEEDGTGDFRFPYPLCHKMERRMSDDLRDRIAAVQSAHDQLAWGCKCGWEYDPLIDDSHFDHVADAVIRDLDLAREVKREQTGTDNPEWRHRLLYDPVIAHRYVTPWEATDD